MRRRTEWFRVAFGGYGRVRPPDHTKDTLVIGSGMGGWWDRHGNPITREQSARGFEEEDTDPG